MQTQLRPNSICVSRDKIRFSLLKDTDQYFDKESEVFDYFTNLIQQYIDDPKFDEIFADATHLNEKARNRTLNKLRFDKEKVSIIPVWFQVSLATALRRNENRTGRAYVPPEAISRMYFQRSYPTFSERYAYSNILVVDEDFNVQEY